MSKQIKTGWRLNGNTCPNCGKPTHYYHSEQDGEDMLDAEKCGHCKWVAVFGDAPVPADVPIGYRVFRV